MDFTTGLVSTRPLFLRVFKHERFLPEIRPGGFYRQYNFINMTETKGYITTKDECQKQIDNHPDFVCSSCGSKLTPMETVDNRDRPTFWSGCDICGHFDYGVRREVFLIAKEMVVHQHYVHYGHVKGRDGNTDEQEFYFKSQIGGTSKFIARVFSVQRDIRQRAMENLLNPASGQSGVNNMLQDPNVKEQEATAETNEQATESAAQDQAMEVDSEEGATEG